MLLDDRWTHTSHAGQRIWLALEKVWLVNFTLYADDSGTSPSNDIAIATALIIPAAQILRLEREWDSFRRKEGFNSFHTAECVARNHKSEFAGWDDVKVRRVLARVRQITKKFAATPAISMAVRKQDYDACMPEHFRHYFGEFHYTWCLSYAIAYSEQVPARLPFEYVFDWMGKLSDPRRKEVERIMEYCERLSTEQGHPGDYTNYSFRRRQEIVGLQCADHVAWTCYQYAQSKLLGRPVSPFAEEAWKDLGMHLGPNGWAHAFTFTRDALREWVAGELADGRSLKRFLEWSKKQHEKDLGI